MSLVFYDYSLPTYIMLFGIVSVCVFFMGTSSCSQQWRSLSPIHFEKKLFNVSVIIRIIYVIFIYFLNYQLYDTYYESSDGDVTWYVPISEYLAQCFRDGILDANVISSNLPALSDSGYVLYLTIVNVLTFGIAPVIIPLLLKAVLGAYSVLFLYRISRRHFGEDVGRLSGIFCMLQFNLIWWCGSMMKETEMIFLCCAFVNYFDKIIYENIFTYKNLFIGLLFASSLFTFRTAIGLCALGSIFVALMFTSSKILSKNKKALIGSFVMIFILLVGGNAFVDDIQEVTENIQNDHQKVNMEWRAEREHGNQFAKYAGAAVFAPLIFTIPFPSMVYTFQQQEMLMQVNGGNYIKNVLSFFVIYAMFFLLFTKKWKNHVFILSFMASYLAALVLSEFAQSGRFHMPIIPLEMMFAAFGLSVIKKRHLNWFNYALAFEFVICIAWAWFKLAGRGEIS